MSSAFNDWWQWENFKVYSTRKLIVLVCDIRIVNGRVKFVMYTATNGRWSLNSRSLQKMQISKGNRTAEKVVNKSLKLRSFLSINWWQFFCVHKIKSFMQIMMKSIVSFLFYLRTNLSFAKPKINRWNNFLATKICQQ